jgi:hypothetical protein
MYSDNKQIRDVADVAARIMSGQQPVTEKLHPNQQQLDVHEPEKDELTADDFKKLRAKKEVKKEEVEELDELSKDTLKSYYKGSVESGMKAQHRATNTSMGGSDSEHKKNITDINKRVSGQDSVTKRLGSKETMSMDKEAGVSRLAKYKPTKPNPKKYSEEVEPILEYETNKDGKFVHNAKAGRYGGSEKPQDPFAGVRGPGQKDLEKIEAEKKKKQKKFSEMVNLYQEKGLKSLSEMLVKEEPDNEQFTKELEDAKAKSEGKKKNTEIAKGSVQAVKSEEIDINDINGVQMSTIEERSLTEPEMKKKEEIVKSMKKGMSGFKERYGDRAKEVMYATATARAKGD